MLAVWLGGVEVLPALYSENVKDASIIEPAEQCGGEGGPAAE